MSGVDWNNLVLDEKRDTPNPAPENCTCIWTQLTWGWKKGAHRQGCPVHYIPAQRGAA